MGFTLLSVTMSNIIYLLIYPAALKYNKVEIRFEHKYPPSVSKHSADLQINVPSSALLFITRSFVAIQVVTSFSNCEIWLQIKPNLDES